MNVTQEYLVSVCIITYNLDKYIARAIDSVLMQKTNFSFEVIVGDDASTDNTLQILEGYRQREGERLTVLRANENKGLMHNFVNVVKAAKGKYIATMDADDYWIDAHKLQAQVDFLNLHNTLAFTFSNYYNEWETNGQRKIALQPVTPSMLEYENYLLNPQIQISTPCIRRCALSVEALEDFAAHNFVAHDLPLFLHLCLRFKGAYMPHITTVCTNRANSESRPDNYQQKINYYNRCQQIGNYFIAKHPVAKTTADKYDFYCRLKKLLTAWEWGNYKQVQENTNGLSVTKFLKHQPKSLYIYLASKNKTTYHLLKAWVLRKRT